MSPNHETAGLWLENMSWPEAEKRLRSARVVLLPLGAAAKQHGPHLPLNNDALIAKWLAREAAARAPVLISPLINVSFYPAFVDYPGSVTLTAATARDLVLQIIGSLAAHGATRFYVLNTGVSTERPLREVGERLDSPELRYAYLRLGDASRRLPPGLLEQGWGTHADEHETSLMLHIAPDVVDMKKAVDDGSDGEGVLRREPGSGIYSPSGIYGQATLASAAKGEVIAAALLEQVLADIESLMTEPD